MTRYRCNTCQGEYEDPGPDGMRYFHACPPIERVRVRRGDRELTVDPADVQADDQILRSVNAPRPEYRDENVNPTDLDERRRARIRSEGKGRTEIERDR